MGGRGIKRCTLWLACIVTSFNSEQSFLPHFTSYIIFCTCGSALRSSIHFWLSYTKMCRAENSYRVGKLTDGVTERAALCRVMLCTCGVEYPV